MASSARAPLPSGLADPGRLLDLVAVREWLMGERERAVDAARGRPREGLAIAGELSGALDELVTALARRFLEPLGPGGLAFLALGEWARAEAWPHGAIRGVLAAASSAGPEALEAFDELGGFLRDAGLDCVFTVTDPAALAAHPPPEAEALDWSAPRLVWGDAAALSALSAALAVSPERRAQMVGLEVLARHAREGGSVCRARPDLVENPGGLRDFAALQWLAALPDAGGLLSAEDLAAARAGAALAAGCRTVAHGLAGGRSDRLLPELQLRLAAALGYRPGEDLGAAALLMRDVFGALRAVYAALKAALAPLEERGEWGARRRTVMDRRRPAGRDFTRIGERLYPARPDLFEGRGAALRMLEGFREAARARLGLSRAFLKGVGDNLWAVNDEFRASAEAAALFREVLATRGSAAPALRAMHECGFLGAWLPEFAELDRLVTADVYHDYTVDEHSLMAVAELDAAERGERGVPELAGRLAGEVSATAALKLAALLHDLGKSKAAAGHEARAAVMLPRIARQLRLGEDEARLLIFLVENHALLAEAAGGRLTSEEQLLAELAERLGEGERLDALYLLTVADLGAVGQGAFPAWRAEQLAALYRRLAGKLSARPARGRTRLAEELLARLPAGVTPADAADHLARVPERYLLEVSAEEAALHLRLLKELAGSPAAVDFHRRRSHVHFWVLGGDRPRRFSQLAGAFLAAGASIFGARAYTRSDGVIIDQFEVVDASAPDSGGSDEFWGAAAVLLREVLAGRADLGALVARARERRSPAERARTDVPVRVAFDNRVSAGHTVVDVTCADRVGLLYDLCGALADAGADIAFAKIATVGGVAKDVFYVTVGGGPATDRETTGRIRAALARACRG